MRFLLVMLISVLLHFSANGAVAKEWATEEAKKAFGTPEDTVNHELLKSKKSYSPKNKTVNKKSVAKMKNGNAVTEPTPSYTFTDKDLPSRETASETGIGNSYRENTNSPQHLQSQQQYEPKTNQNHQVQRHQGNPAPGYQTKDSFGNLVNSGSSYQTKDSFGNLVNSKSSYQTTDSFGNLVNSNSCYQTKDSFGNLVQSAGCSR